jgi:hypothetical protein
MKIKTYEHPWNQWEGITWNAIDEDTYDGAEDSHCPVGHGSTEHDAIINLVEQIIEPMERRLEVLLKSDWDMKKEIMRLQDDLIRLRSTSAEHTLGS